MIFSIVHITAKNSGVRFSPHTHIHTLQDIQWDHFSAVKYFITILGKTNWEYGLKEWCRLFLHSACVSDLSRRIARNLIEQPSAFWTRRLLPTFHDDTNTKKQGTSDGFFKMQIRSSARCAKKQSTLNAKKDEQEASVTLILRYWRLMIEWQNMMTVSTYAETNKCYI